MASVSGSLARCVVSKSMFILGSPGSQAGHFTSVFTSIISLPATNTTSAAGILGHSIFVKLRVQSHNKGYVRVRKRSDNDQVTDEFQKLSDLDIG